MSRSTGTHTFFRFPRKPRGRCCVALLFLLALGWPVSSPAAAEQAPDTSERVWLDAEGNPLPFSSDEEILEFLRTARVVKMRESRTGITRPHHVWLEKDGIRMHAFFHDLNQEKSVARLARGRTEIGFRDTYLFNIAAYELGRLLGLDNVPPAVKRKIRGKTGSLQVWIENTMNERDRLERKINPPDIARWNQQLYVMRVFDNLIENTDRSQENIVIDPSTWKVWLIDYTRAFRRSPDLPNPKAIIKCERNFWEKLRGLDEAVVKQRLKKFLRSSEIKALFKRRQKLVEHIQKLIDERGEENVLYTLNNKL